MTDLPTLVLLHGVGDAGACWGPFVDRLRHEPGLARLEVVTPNAPGHGGRATSAGHTLAFPDQVAEAADLLSDTAAHADTPIVLGGHSMGAAVALEAAAACPESVAALWLEDPPLFASFAAADSGQGPAVDLAEMRPWLAELQSIGLDDLVAAARAEHPDWPPAEHRPWAEAKHGVDLRAFTTPLPWQVSRWAHAARTVTCPVVVAAGLVRRGGLVTESAAADLATLPSWTVLRMPTGHDVRREAPRAAAQALGRLIRSSVAT